MRMSKKEREIFIKNKRETLCFSCCVSSLYDEVVSREEVPNVVDMTIYVI